MLLHVLADYEPCLNPAPTGTLVYHNVAAKVSDGSYEVEEGDLAPGSSAWESFGSPDVGARVGIEAGP